nr:hypothetical protein GCM10020063_040670 [Dactylosporangium thailandense]
MTDSAGDPHVRLSLGAHLLGELAPPERDAVERHLATCPACRLEADELAVVLDALVLLTDEDSREVVAEFGVLRPEAATASAAPAAAAGPAEPPQRPDRALKPARPAAGRPAARPSSARGRLHSRSRLGLAGLALVVVTSAVTFVTLGLSGPSAPPDPVVITLAATAQNTATGAHLSVLATGHDGRVTIHATVTGLHHDSRYQLYAVTSDGTTRVVAEWTGSDAAQQVSGAAPVTVAELSFFTVTLSDGTPVVSAYLPRPAPATT